jgi:hypothetical protein
MPAALRLAASDRIIPLREPAGGESIRVEGDADRMAQVVTNYMGKNSRALPGWGRSTVLDW